MLPSSNLSKSQMDRLGDRLRKGDISDGDLRLLDSYRRSFSKSYEEVVQLIEDELGFEATGRPAKSTTSIIEKLRRERIRLSQMQDIAGCRIITSTLAQQDNIVTRIPEIFDQCTIVDRRERPSHGYRAVHVIVNRSSKLIEVQIRTSLQHTWAELSEKLADEFDSSIKYGGGSERIGSYLSELSVAMLNTEIALKIGDGNQIMIETQRLFELVGKFGALVDSERE